MTKLPYEPHPYANYFPLEEGPTLWEMSDRMKDDGFDKRHKIVLYQGKVLDGRRRQLAAHRAKVEPVYEEFKGDDLAALKFVRRENLDRRNLGTGDRSMVAAKMAAEIEKHAITSGNGAQSANLRPALQKQVAEEMNVSRRSVQNAASVLKNGTPELKKAVEEHVISVSDAAKVATQPPAVQRKAVEQVTSGKATTAASTVKKPGSIKYDWHASDKQFGAVARWPDAVASAYPGEKKSDEYKRVIALLTELGEVRKGWHTRLKKVKE